jgi:hypothetical protein
MSTHLLAPAVLVLGGVVTLAGTAWTLAADCEGRCHRARVKRSP